MPSGDPNRSLPLIFGSLALLAVFVGTLMVGAVNIPVSHLWEWATGSLADDSISGRVLTGIRLPRSIGAVVVGAALGVGGIAIQGIHRTRVIDAHLVGISAASGLGVALGYAVAPHTAATLVAVAAAILLGGVYAVSSRLLGDGASVPIGIVLIGIASGLAITAWTGLFVIAVDSSAVPSLSYFVFGSLAGITWTMLWIATPCVFAGICVLWWLGPGLDVLTLGERASIHLGFDARNRIPIALAAIGMITGASVAAAGVVGFVGLIVPLITRPLVGATHRVSIPAAAVGGAILLLLLDTAARTIAAPIEIPIGLLTAAIGGPILVLLVRREMTR